MPQPFSAPTIESSQESSPAAVSRRGFLKVGALAAVAPVLGGWSLLRAAGDDANGAAAGDHGFAPATDYLAAARSTARWIESARHDEADGSRWLPDPDHPELAATVSPTTTLYSGSAGVVLSLLELAAATGDDAYLSQAKRGADYLVAHWREQTTAAGSMINEPASLHFGVTGTAFVLNEAAKATGVSAYREAAEAIGRYVLERARKADGGLSWSPMVGISGDAGVLLFLLYAATEFDQRDYLQAAHRGGHFLLSQASREPGGGLAWRKLPPELAKKFQIPADSYYPNFEGGTAGVAYALARLYEQTDDAKLLQAARDGVSHLQHIATVRGEAALIPYRLPDLPDLYYLGYCHGPAGTARTFYKLYQITKERAYLAWTEKLAQGVIDSAIATRRAPGYWNTACQCCGDAAIVEFFTSLWAATGRADYLAYARGVADVLLSRGVDLDGKGLHWYQAWTRIKPALVNTETGYMIGAAGISSALLHLHSAQQGRYRALLLPDNPFPRALG